MTVKKSLKVKANNKNEGGISPHHRNFLAMLVLFTGFSLYAITSFMSSNNSYIKRMFADVLVSDQVQEQPVNRENPFTDLPDYHQSYQAVIELYYRGVVGGYSDNTFKPDNKVNRAEFAKMLVEASDVDYSAVPSQNIANCFTDVNVPGAWFEPSVCAAKYKGWVNGYAGGEYGVTRNITKSEGLKIVLKAFNLEVPANETVVEMPFNDVHPEDWFLGVARAAKDNALVSKAAVFVPGWELTRADVAQIIYKAMRVKGLVQ